MNDDLVKRMVDRFLGWRLPQGFAPDGSISFKNEPDARGYMPTWPTGTNLFDATQARQMIEHMLAGEALQRKVPKMTRRYNAMIAASPEPPKEPTPRSRPIGCKRGVPTRLTVCYSLCLNMT